MSHPDHPPPRPLPAARLLAPGAFYGWTIAGGVSLLSLVVVGVGFYGLVVFLDALCTERGWSRPQVSFATSLYFVTSGVAGVFVGRSVDRHGPRLSLALGAGVMALALLLLGRVAAPWQLALVYPLLAVGFAMAGSVPTSAIMTRWFVARRARAMSFSFTGVSLGGIVLVPLITGMILRDGLAATTQWLAALVLLVVLPVVVFLLRADPRDHGLEPDGGAQPSAPQPEAHRLAQERTWTSRQALRAKTFWVLVVAFSGILFCQVGVAMHQLSLLREHLDASTAAFSVSTTAFGSMAARLVVGAFADRVSLRLVGVALMVVQAAAIVGLALSSTAVPLYAASLVFGFTIGNVFMLQSLLVGELFGMRSFGTVLALLQLITQIGSGLGPYALGLLHAAFGGYSTGLLVLSLVALGAALVLSRVKPPAPA